MAKKARVETEVVEKPQETKKGGDGEDDVGDFSDTVGAEKEGGEDF